MWRRGFNLLEMMVGLLLFTIIATAFGGVWNAYYQMIGKARSTLVASHLAEDIMEGQLALGWQSVTVNPGPGHQFTMVQVVDGNETEIVYDYWIEVRDLSDPGYIGLKQVVVHVSWNEPSGKREVTCETLLYWGG